MFLKPIKDFSLKKSVKILLDNAPTNVTAKSIKTIGLLLDATYLPNLEVIIDELQREGISATFIEVLVFKEEIHNGETFFNSHFSYQDISVWGTFQSESVKLFVAKPFDMLISYYDKEKTPLLIVTLQSKAGLKVGFSSVNKRLNNLMITTAAENHHEFITELFRYLKILNKIE